MIFQVIVCYYPNFRIHNCSIFNIKIMEKREKEKKRKNNIMYNENE